MKKFTPHFPWLLGLVFLLVGAGKDSGATLPDPDPTPELLANQRAQLQTAELIASFGAILFISGITWLIVRRSRKPSSAQ